MASSRNCFLSVLIGITLFGALSAQGTQPQQMRFGLRLPPSQWDGVESALSAAPSDPANPLLLTLTLPAAWAQSPDWAGLERAVAAARGANATVAISSELPGDPEAPTTLTYLVALSERVGHAADLLELSVDLSAFPEPLRSDPDRLALCLKRLSTSLRGEGRAQLFLGGLTSAALPLLKPLYERDLRAYVDGYKAPGNASGIVESAVPDFLQSHHLGAPLWTHLPAVKTGLGAQVTTLAGLHRGAALADIESASPGEVWSSLLRIRAALSPGMAPGVAAEATGIFENGKYRGDVGILSFLDAETFSQAMLLVANRSGSSAATLDIALPTVGLASPRAYALPSEGPQPLTATEDGKKRETTLQLPWKGTPLLVLLDRRETAVENQGEVSVSATYRLPVELILARHQAVQQAQEILLQNYTAKARVDYHFKLPGSAGSFDIAFLNTFFFEQGHGARWVQDELLVNGVAWKGKKIPELPIIEPEKVNTLPLALTLGREYAYKYLRDEEVDGHPCFIVEFLPLPEAQGSLYEGRVWIDRENYSRRKMVVRQTGLEPPQISNEESDTFTDVTAADGRAFRLLTRVAGQQILSFMGRNVVAEREVRFEEIRVNASDFATKLATAEAGESPMLQETAQGPRYLEKQADGGRTLKADQDTSRLFALGGVYYDESLEFPLPLVGVNWFDWDWHKTGTQVNLFAAGVVNTLTVSKANLAPKLDGRAEALVFLVPFQDKLFLNGVEDERQRVKILRERATVGLGWRATEFSKVSLSAEATYFKFKGDGEEMTPQPAGLPYPAALPSDFALPADHTDLGFSLGYDYTRRGWGAALEVEGHRRSNWRPWGLFAENSDASQKEAYARWSAAFSKTFYLPKFQKVGVSANWFGGKDLDRFSQYGFTYLGKRSLSGFSGSGVRFDQGVTARLLYEFNLGEVIRFGVTLDGARVQPDKRVDLWEKHAGVGLTASVTGPWKTLWGLDAGYALQSDIPAAEGKYTVALVVMKLW